MIGVVGNRKDQEKISSYQSKLGSSFIGKSLSLSALSNWLLGLPKTRLSKFRKSDPHEVEAYWKNRFRLSYWILKETIKLLYLNEIVVRIGSWNRNAVLLLGWDLIFCRLVTTWWTARSVGPLKKKKDLIGVFFWLSIAVIAFKIHFWNL